MTLSGGGRVRLGAVLLCLLGGGTGLVATWLAAGSGEATRSGVVLALVSCILTTVGARLVALGRGRLAALLLAEAAVGLGLGIGEHALIPGAVLLSAVVLAGLGRGGRGRGRRT